MPQTMKINRGEVNDSVNKPIIRKKADVRSLNRGRMFAIIFISHAQVF